MKLKYIIIISIFLIGIVALGMMIFTSLTGNFKPAHMLESCFYQIEDFAESTIESFNRIIKDFISNFRY